MSDETLLPVSTQTRPTKQPSRSRRIIFWVGVIAVAGLGLAGLAAGSLQFSSAGSSLTRKDFENDMKAASFVSAHLPAPLPPAALVRELQYDHFTDWHLEAVVQLGTAKAMEAYLQNVRAVRQQNMEYCGGPEAGSETQFFLPEVHACGAIRPGAKEGELIVHCYTR